MTPEEYQQHVLGPLATTFPDEEFEGSPPSSSSTARPSSASGTSTRFTLKNNLSSRNATPIPCQIHATEAPQSLLAIQTGDGYVAARLLLPAMRKLAIEHLGEPCYAAVPNRDFLIMWSQSNAEEFQTLVRGQVRQDFESQSYPLTSTVFVVTEADVKPEVA